VRRTLRALLTVTVLHAAVAHVDAQSVPGRSFRALSTNVPQSTASNGVREVRVGWTVVSGPARETVAGDPNRFAVVAQQASAGSLRRERNPQLAPDRLVLVSEDASGREVDWRIVPNPRIVRAESPRADGQLQGRTVEREVTEFSITIPDIPSLRRIRFYQPRWAGTEYLLDQIGAIDVGAGGR
jgi:hypothetical protein